VSATVYVGACLGRHKIGRCAGDPRARFAEFLTPAPVDLVAAYLVDAVPQAVRVEAALHREFAAFRRHGEWFDLPPDWRPRADGVVFWHGGWTRCAGSSRGGAPCGRNAPFPGGSCYQHGGAATPPEAFLEAMRRAGAHAPAVGPAWRFALDSTIPRAHFKR
jgi:hypothetical protein